jgi:hypothetical protein
MMGLVNVVGDVDVAVERARRLQESRGGVLESLANEVLREGRAEAEVVDYVGDVRHVRREVVALRLGLYVEVPGSAIDEEEAREETPRMVLVDPGVLYVTAAGLEGSGVRDVLLGLYSPRRGGWGFAVVVRMGRMRRIIARLRRLSGKLRCI